VRSQRIDEVHTLFAPDVAERAVDDTGATTDSSLFCNIARSNDVYLVAERNCIDN
jgi:hypothetical protein